MKLYGVLLGKEELADKLFQEQVDKLKAIEDSESTGKTVAFFYINSVGAANVRKSGDYVSKMIELAGGKYIFSDLGAEDDNWCTNQNLFQETMELGTMIEDIHTMLTSDDPNLDTLTYMHKLK